MITETITLIHNKAANGKVLTDGTQYVHEVYLVPSEDPAKWTEIDASEVPVTPSPDEYANTEPEE